MQRNIQPRRYPLPFFKQHHLKASHVLLILAGCMALQTTSFAIILPLFARRFTALGAGVAALGISSMAYALTSTLAAPVMGSLADRRGRRPVVLLSLGVYVLAFSGYLLAASASVFILLRAVAGALTAGLMPAVLGIVADLAPEDRKGQWIGRVNGGSAAGWIIGPILGGWLFDRFGYAVPFLVSILVGGLAFITTFLLIPETHPPNHSAQDPVDRGRILLKDMIQTVPRPITTFAVLMLITFTVMFAGGFFEPQYMFYVYDELSWTSAQLGAAMSIYGAALTVGQFTLARQSDRWGRKPVIILGLALYATQFFGLLFFTRYAWIGLSVLMAGLGTALYDPALSAYLLDISAPEHKAQTMGIKSMVASLGGVLGPALVVILAPAIHSQGIFLSAGLAVILVMGVSALALPPGKSEFGR